MRALLGFFVFTIAGLGVAGGLLAVHRHLTAGIAAARSWSPVPCAIERAGFVVVDGGRVLEVAYRYEIGGRSYAGDRLDLLPGRMGDDGPWEEALLAAHPAGSTATCWVDPADPTRAVLDREHGADAAGRLLVLAFPFGFVGLAFGYGLVSTIVTALRAGRERPAPALAPPPRRVPILGRTALLVATSPTIRLAWPFLVGFTLVFVFLDGPAHVGGWLAGPAEPRMGVVTRVTPIGARELGETVYAFAFRYEADGREHTGVSRARGREWSVGDRAPVVHHPARPDASHLEGARRTWTPVWIVAIPAVVMALLAFGIVGTYVWNARNQRLLARGALAHPESATQFRVGSERIDMDRRSLVTGECERSDVTILYDPARPTRNLALGPDQRRALAGGREALLTIAGALVVPTACTVAIAWLLFGVELSL